MSQNPIDFVEDAALTLPPGCSPDGVTADDHVFAFWQQPNGQIRFVWAGVAGQPFDEVGAMRDETRVFWSDDARHVAYIGLRGEKSFVGRDGGVDPEFEAPTRSVPPTFSAGGAHLVYGAQVHGSFRLIVDGTVAGAESLAPIAAIFSPDGMRLAFVEMRDPADAKPEMRIVLDGVPGPWFRGMRNAQGVMQFSPDSRRFAYYRINDKVEGQWVVDDREQRWVNDVRSFGMAMITGVGVLDPPMLAGFSPDSGRFAYWADVKEKG